MAFSSNLVTYVTPVAICAVIFVVPLITVLAAIVVALSIVGNLDTVPHRLATGEYCRRFKNLCGIGQSR